MCVCPSNARNEPLTLSPTMTTRNMRSDPHKLERAGGRTVGTGVAKARVPFRCRPKRAGGRASERAGAANQRRWPTRPSFGRVGECPCGAWRLCRPAVSNGRVCCRGNGDSIEHRPLDSISCSSSFPLNLLLLLFLLSQTRIGPEGRKRKQKKVCPASAEAQRTRNHIVFTYHWCARMQTNFHPKFNHIFAPSSSLFAGMQSPCLLLLPLQLLPAR